MTDRILIDRLELHRLAIRRHIRFGSGGVELPNGGSCKLCNGKWRHGDAEWHATTCPLADPEEDVLRYRFVRYNIGHLLSTSFFKAVVQRFAPVAK